MKFIWPIWAVFFGGTFLIFEIYAIETGNQTLTNYVRQFTADYPWTIFFMGLFIGGLAMHFWYRISS